jgi:hypothetical protein
MNGFEQDSPAVIECARTFGKRSIRQKLLIIGDD